MEDQEEKLKKKKKRDTDSGMMQGSRNSSYSAWLWIKGSGLRFVQDDTYSLGQRCGIQC